jgi:mannose/fructose/N-acetylgalactosamine-specific phosphotransferase system component IIB
VIACYPIEAQGTIKGNTTLVFNDSSYSSKSIGFKSYGFDTAGLGTSAAGASSKITPDSSPKQQDNIKGSVTIPVVPELKEGTTTAETEVTNDTLSKALKLAVADNNGVKTVVIGVQKVAGATEYVQKLPASALTGTDAKKVIEISTPVGTINAAGNMFTDAQTKGIRNISLKIGIVDKDKLKLSQAAKDAIGNRPVIELSAVADNKILDWSNPDASVEISFKYSEESKDPQYTTVWYIDGSGKAVPVPNATYKVSTRMITFRTTHFSNYAIVYNHKTFGDLQNYSWAKQSVEVLASKGILEGKGENSYAPSANVTRADFLMYLVRALGLSAKFDNNFDDVKNSDSYYEAIGTAKKLGITDGTGNNKFNPDAAITREDMMVFSVKALKAAGKIHDTGKLTDLSKFNDKSKISTYAVEGVATLVKMGIAQGSNKCINPKGNTTRAETACIIYRIIKLV